MRGLTAALLVTLLALAGALGSTLFLHRAASAALDRVLEERLRGAGETAAQLLAGRRPQPAELRALMAANELEGAYVLDAALEVLADATGPAGGRADLLRVDPARVAEAAAGRSSVALAYAVGDHPIATGYFPIPGEDGRPAAVLALEAGQAFLGARAALSRALGVGVGLAALGALALGALALRWTRLEGRRRLDAERAARGDALARMGAMVAHEIRNPLGVIRGSIELVQARSAAALGARDREALADVLGEVERLRRVSEDFLDLAREPRLATGLVDLCVTAADAARGIAAAFPSLGVSLELPALTVAGDAVRLRQVFTNLLLNAAQAGARSVLLRGAAEGASAVVEVRDDGPGVPPELRARLFEAFATGHREGTGLGLAISRRIVERHGGELRHVAGGPGATFVLRLPLAGG